jgi:threonine dehydrogenase-like Zn-dependent dehydrogenase
MQPREGGFAEQLAMPERNLVALPDTISTDKAALAEPIACGWHAVRLGKALLAKPSEAALVMGGGAIGLGAALSLKAQGISDVLIIEPNAQRRAYLADQCGQKSMRPRGYLRPNSSTSSSMALASKPHVLRLPPMPNPAG